MIWLLFAATIALLLVIDLGVVSRRPHTLSLREAASWSAAVVLAAAVFGVAIWVRHGRTDAVQFATGYVVELSLSVDNLLVFLLILRYFAVPAALQPTVLKWGILGAIVMRGLMIGAGVLALDEFHWVIYLLGLLLVVTGARMFARGEVAALDPGSHPVVRAARRILPMSDRFEGAAFFTRVDGRRLMTPLLLVVLVIEWTDLVFATDSIPAIFAITRNPLLVYTSNILAIVGLRAMFFLLAGLLTRFGHLRIGVAAVLVLAGAKMLAEPWVHVPPAMALVAVVVILALSIVIPTRQEHETN